MSAEAAATSFSAAVTSASAGFWPRSLRSLRLLHGGGGGSFTTRTVVSSLPDASRVPSVG